MPPEEAGQVKIDMGTIEDDKTLIVDKLSISGIGLVPSDITVQGAGIEFAEVTGCAALMVNGDMKFANSPNCYSVAPTLACEACGNVVFTVRKTDRNPYLYDSQYDKWYKVVLKPDPHQIYGTIPKPPEVTLEPTYAPTYVYHPAFGVLENFCDYDFGCTKCHCNYVVRCGGTEIEIETHGGASLEKYEGFGTSYKNHTTGEEFRTSSGPSEKMSTVASKAAAEAKKKIEEHLQEAASKAVEKVAGTVVDGAVQKALESIFEKVVKETVERVRAEMNPKDLRAPRSLLT